MNLFFHTKKGKSARAREKDLFPKAAQNLLSKKQTKIVEA
jgi:hypothetical protein